MSSSISAYAQDVLNLAGPFLDETDAEAARARAVIDENIHQHRANVDLVNALIVVGAFISGVQAQVISFTFQSNDTSLATAANWFAFVGLTLDVVGTTTGVVHALAIQRAIRLYQHRHHRIDSADQARIELRRLLSCTASGTSHTPNAALREKIQESLRVQIRARVEAQTFNENATLWRTMINAGQSASGPMAFIVQLADELLSHLGRVPIALMSCGIISLTLCILCFAADTQRSGVWVSCSFIAAGMGLLALAIAVGYTLNAIFSDIRNRRLVDEESERIAAHFLPKA